MTTIRITPILGPGVGQSFGQGYWDTINDPRNINPPTYGPGTRVSSTGGADFIYVKAHQNLSAGDEFAINQATFETESGSGFSAVEDVPAGEWFLAKDGMSGGGTPPGNVNLLSVKVLNSTQGSDVNPADSGGGHFVELVFDGDLTDVVLDATKITGTATSPGYVNGAPSSVVRSLQCHMARWGHANAEEGTAAAAKTYYSDDGSGNTVMHLVMSQPIYGGDSNVSLTFAAGWADLAGDTDVGGTGTLPIAEVGDAAYPIVHAKWATEDFRPLLHGVQTFEVCAHAARAWDDEHDGKRRPADAVNFTISNGTTTVNRTITAITNSTYFDEVDAYLSAVFGANFGASGDQPLTVTRPANMPAQPVFACSVDLAAEGFAIGDEITVTAEATPFIGNNPKQSDGVQDAGFDVQTHKLLGTARRFIAIDRASGTTSPTTFTTAEGDNSATIRAAMDSAVLPANASANGQNAYEKGNQANLNGAGERTCDGMVVLVPAGLAQDLGSTASRTGDIGKSCEIVNDLVGSEVIPVPGIAADSVVVSEGLSGRIFPGRVRVFGASADHSYGNTPFKVTSGNLSDAFTTQAVLFCAGSNGSGNGEVLSNADMYNVMGGDYADIGTAFGIRSNWRGVRIGVSNSGENICDLALGCDMGGYRILNDIGTSSISSDHKMRWACLARQTGEAINTGQPNLNGYSILSCAATSGDINKMYGDDNTNDIANVLIAMFYLQGPRLNHFYDTEEAAYPLRQSIEVYGTVLTSHNIKRPVFSIGRPGSGPDSAYYRWAGADAPYALAPGIAAYNTILMDGQDTRPVDGLGYMYGIYTGGTSEDLEYPEPLVDPVNGDWTPHSQASWQALASTIALEASPLKHPTQDYSDNIIANVVPAAKVPLPFDLWGNTYPTSGMTEAGPFRRM